MPRARTGRFGVGRSVRTRERLANRRACRDGARTACALRSKHVTFWIVARGINIGLHTRMYFGDEAEANAEDPVLAKIPQRGRVPTLIAPRDGNSFTFDIRLQGDDETVFFDI